MGDEKYMTAEQVAAALGLSVNVVKRLTRQRKIPVLALGYRTRVYEVSEVRRALKKLTIYEVGRKF